METLCMSHLTKCAESWFLRNAIMVKGHLHLGCKILDRGSRWKGGDHKKDINLPVTITRHSWLQFSEPYVVQFLMVIDPLNQLMIQTKIIHLRWGWPLMFEEINEGLCYF